MALGEGDQVITSYRDHGHMLACGMDANGVMAELTGRRGGYSKGNSDYAKLERMLADIGFNELPGLSQQLQVLLFLVVQSPFGC